jgi:hypothetical protein
VDVSVKMMGVEEQLDFYGSDIRKMLVEGRWL